MSRQLEERFLNYALRVRDFCLKLKWNIINQEYVKQLIRSSASVGANYLEASDDLGKQDKRMKLKISRREAKESVYWLTLIIANNEPSLEHERLVLADEGTQIVKILSTILQRICQET